MPRHEQIVAQATRSSTQRVGAQETVSCVVQRKMDQLSPAHSRAGMIDGSDSLLNRTKERSKTRLEFICEGRTGSWPQRGNLCFQCFVGSEKAERLRSMLVIMMRSNNAGPTIRSHGAKEYIAPFYRSLAELRLAKVQQRHPPGASRPGGKHSTGKSSYCANKFYFRR